MPYLARDAANTLFGYLNIEAENIEYVPDTNNRGFVYTDGGGNKSIIFIYPISHKADNSKNFFDTRDSGARERGIAWNYAVEHHLKYFCFAVHDQVEKYNDYIFSLESEETRVATVSGTTNGTRSGPGTQVVIPNDYIPSMPFDRIRTQMGFYIAVIHRDYIVDYIEKFDNRPYMADEALVSTGETVFLSPEWFREKAQEFPNLDSEAATLYQQFQNDYSLEQLRSFEGEDLLRNIFLGNSETNLCHALEFDDRYNQFGSIAGGNAYKYTLFYSRNDESWKTSVGEGGQRSITIDEAITIGAQIRDYLVTGAEIIQNHGVLTNANDYVSLFDELNAVIPQYITKMWFLKYYHMMFPSIFPVFYNEAWHKHILCNLNILPNDVQFVRMGQISCFTNECGISALVFAKIVSDYLGYPKNFFRIGTGDNGQYFDDWRNSNYVAIGWNELGNLANFYTEGVNTKEGIMDALKDNWSYNPSLAGRKYKEINNFYSSVANETYVVAMNGYKVLAIGMITGGYYLDMDREFGHCRDVQWLKVFDESKTMPKEDEGIRTTFFPLVDSQNLCYLYSLLRDDEIADVAESTIQEIVYRTNCDSHNFSRNRIVFGAPGTGKSFTVNKERKILLGEDNEADYERVTFHPDYSYANFVGTYKPVPVGTSITYEYVPGPFMRMYVKALKNARTDIAKPFLLIIEEINRANVAAVFGDIFQLLDRDDEEISEYPIQASEDIKKYLAKELGGDPEDYFQIRIPDNMFVWATMNSADQGVFPIDTAFKRRWDFTYIGIDASEEQILNKTVVLGTRDKARIVYWNELRHAINDRLSTFKINEDKLLGPYFLSKKVVPQEGNIDRKTFIKAFKNKVLMYLFDDAAKQKRPSLFAEGLDTTKYSAICDEFEKNGVFAFCTDISSRFTTIPTEAEETDPTVQEGEDE